MSNLKTGTGHRRNRDYDYDELEVGIQGDQLKKKEVAEAKREETLDKSSITDQVLAKSREPDKNAQTYEKRVNKAKETREQYLRRKFNSQVAQIEREVEWLGKKIDMTPKEVAEYKEKQAFLESIRTSVNNEAQYILPSECKTAEGHIDRKRKQELLRPKNDDQPEEKRLRFENQWELDQLKKAQEIMASNPDKIELADQEHYDYVFDESQFVDFDEDTELPGEKEMEESEDPKLSDKVSREIQEVRRSLPVYKLRKDFLEAIEKNQVLIVVGETGSGKTTQLPQYLYEAGYTRRSESGKIQKVGCTQPRRVAATSVAARVADEVGCRLGNEVGYSIRFEDVLSSKTQIKYLTDGMLLREFLSDPLLSTYSALMIDEAHERTVSTEIILTLLKDIIKERPDLRVIVASATINADKFANYFDGAPIFKVPGRRFPVDICYTKHPEANYIQAAITTVFQIHMKQETPGDILVFLTGQDEIETMAETLNEACENLGDLIKPLIVAPIYANMPPAMQARIFEPTPHDSRKVVLATNIAETSITIDGIKYVVDPGYVKENVFNPTTGMESLVVVPCSRASADQRAGRAGRVGPGKCYRLFTKWSFYNELVANPTPEILRVNLGTVVLLLMSMGTSDLVHFDFMDPPSTQTLMKSLELLYSLGALNVQGQLTNTGRKMSEFPMDPMFCKCLLTSSQFGVTYEVMSILAMLAESSNLFYRPKDKREQADKRKLSFAHDLGDHLTLLNIWRQWTETGFSNIWCEDNFLQYRTLKRVKEVRSQLEKLCQKIGLNTEKTADDDQKLIKIQKSLFSGFFPNVAKLSKLGTSYVLVKRNQPVHIHPSSGLFQVKPPPKFVLYHELVLTSKEYMRSCMVIDESWLGELANHYYKNYNSK